MKLDPVIGLEIHVQLKTQSKMFCSCKNGVETPPNAAICPICMGHPGTLPVPNATAELLIPNQIWHLQMRLHKRLHRQELFGERQRLRVAHLPERRDVRGRPQQLPLPVRARLRRAVLRDRAGRRRRVPPEQRLPEPRLQKWWPLHTAAWKSRVHLQVPARYV